MIHPRVGRADALAIAIAATTVVVFGYQVSQLFGRLPVVWPDESLFAEPALRLLHDGRLASPLVTGAAAGVAERTYWYPFGYFLLLAGGFAIAGPTLAVMRALSVAGGLVLMLTTFRVGRSMGWGRPMAATAVALLAADPVFVRAALVGRPDVLALALLGLSLLLGPDGPAPRRFAAGLCAGCATLIHPFGVIALIILGGQVARRRLRRSAPAIAGATLPLLAWAAYALQDLPAFVDQVGLNFALHERPWTVGGVIANILNQYPDPLALVFVFAWVAGAIGLAIATRRDRRGGPVLAAFALTSALALSLQMWHPLYALPFMYLGVARLLGEVAPAPRKRVEHLIPRALLAAVSLAVLAGLIAVDVDQLAERARVAATVRREAYGEWSDAIAGAIPAGSRVLIGGVPDPAWGLFGRDLRLVALQDDSRSYRHYQDRIAAEVDYVILSGSVTRRWLELVEANSVLVRLVLVDTGQHDTGCEDWVPCGPLAAKIYRIRP